MLPQKENPKKSVIDNHSERERERQREENKQTNTEIKWNEMRKETRVVTSNGEAKTKESYWC